MKNRRIWWLLVLIGLAVHVHSGSCLATTSQDVSLLEEILQEQLNALDLGEILSYKELIDYDYQEYLPSFTWRDIVGSNASISLVEILTKFIRAIFKEILYNIDLMRQLLVIAVLSAFFRQLQLAYDSKSMGEIAFAVCFLIMIFVGLQSFRSALALATEALDNMVSFMYAILPLMSSLLAAVGGISSATIFHPVLIMTVSGVVQIMRIVQFPLLNISAVLGLVANFSSDFPLSKLASLARHACVMVLSFSLTIFLGVLAVRGAIAPVADGVSLRAAKFITSNVVPVIGSIFSNAVEVIVGGSLLIKNTVGVFGLLVIFFMVTMPILKIWAIVIIYKVIKALIQPICDQRLVDAIGGLESSLTLVMVSLAVVALMFFIALVILIGFGNLAALMR